MHVIPLYSSKLFGIAMMIYLLATLIYISFLSFKKESLGFSGTLTLFVGFLIHTAGIAFRWFETHKTGYGYVPLSNMYESLMFFSWTIVLIYLLIEKKYGQRSIGAFTAPIAFLAIAITSITPGISSHIEPLIPALQSNWLTIHVTTCFFGYAAFAVSFGISIMYLVQYKKERISEKVNWLPESEILDQLNYKTVIIGFPMLTLGIITGAAWAYYAWGSYWSWDPKETWSLVTWFIYAAFLHARLTTGWRGKKIAILSIIGFAAVLFTYFGVNYILVGLHSYAS